MPDNKVKIYKNPQRQQQENYKPYVPNYQLMGIDPTEGRDNKVTPSSGNSRVVIVPPSATAGGSNSSNFDPSHQRGSKTPMRQSYAIPTKSPIGKNPIPNTGNNMEHTWLGNDQEIIDDLDPNTPMIDNNDYVTDNAFKLGVDASDLVSEQQFHAPISIRNDKFDQSQNTITNNNILNTDICNTLQSLDNNEYLLIVAGEPLLSGGKDDVEEQARLLVFGEHELCGGESIPLENIVIVKKVNIKVGLFLD